MGEASADAGLGGAANATDRPPPVSSLLDFSGETVVVTGASGGLGRGIALRFVEAGANVVVHYSKDEKHAAEVKRAVEREGGRAVAVGADLTIQSEVNGLFDECVAGFGGVNARRPPRELF